MKPFEQQTYYELLEIPVTAPVDDIRAAYSRLMELYAPDSIAVYALVDPEQVDSLRARMTEAVEILTDADLRAEYDKDLGLPVRRMVEAVAAGGKPSTEATPGANTVARAAEALTSTASAGAPAGEGVVAREARDRKEPEQGTASTATPPPAEPATTPATPGDFRASFFRGFSFAYVSSSIQDTRFVGSAVYVPSVTPATSSAEARTESTGTSGPAAAVQAPAAAGAPSAAALMTARAESGEAAASAVVRVESNEASAVTPMAVPAPAAAGTVVPTTASAATATPVADGLVAPTKDPASSVTPVAAGMVASTAASDAAPVAPGTVASNAAPVVADTVAATVASSVTPVAADTVASPVAPDAAPAVSGTVASPTAATESPRAPEPVRGTVANAPARPAAASAPGSRAVPPPLPSTRAAASGAPAQTAAPQQSGETSAQATPPAQPVEQGRPTPRPASGRQLGEAQVIAQDSAIATAESALAQVAARVRDPQARPRPPDIPADAEFNGELLRRVREARGQSLQQVADRTRITKAHLENVEADRYAALPPPVYLRGILMNLARELGLDPLRVSRSYLALASEKSGKK